jgi:hypothetical protein
MDDLKFKSDMEFITWIFALGQCQKEIEVCAKKLERYIDEVADIKENNRLNHILYRLQFISKQMEP